MQSTSEMWLGFITVKWRIWWEENWSHKEVGEWKSGMNRHPEYLEMQWDSLGLWAWALRRYLPVGWWRYQGTRLDHSGKHLLFPPNAFKKWRQTDTPRSILKEQAKAANSGANCCTWLPALSLAKWVHLGSAANFNFGSSTKASYLQVLTWQGKEKVWVCGFSLAEFLPGKKSLSSYQESLDSAILTACKSCI